MAVIDPNTRKRWQWLVLLVGGGVVAAGLVYLYLRVRRLDTKLEGLKSTVAEIVEMRNNWRPRLLAPKIELPQT